MSVPTRAIIAWPPGSSPFSRTFRDSFNSVAEIANWVQRNQGDIEDLLVRPEHPDPIIPGPMFATITGHGSPFAPNRWEYSWDAAKFTPSARVFGPFTRARSSTDANETTALNLAEFLNTADVAAHGVFLHAPEVPEAVGTVEPIPDGTPVMLWLAPTQTTSTTRFRMFSEVNAINFECGADQPP